MKKNKATIAVQLQQVTKTYQLHHEKPIMADRLFRFQKDVFFTALKSIDLTIYKGEKIGIIGSNGSGKTTLLKHIVGISTPTKGTVTTHGKIVSLIDVEAGFHPDLSGLENIFLNSLMVGMSKKEVAQKLKQIIKFADIGDFIDAPLYTYSQGMKLRLGFSVAVHADPDILILDEGIVAGDADFQKKSRKKIADFFKQKKTIITVTHWVQFLRANCRRIIWLDKGTIKADGTLAVIDTYLKSVK